MARRAYSDETKAAVLAALMQGQSVTYVAQQYNIPPGTIGSWKKRNLEKSGTVAAGANKKTNERIGELLLQYMEASLESLIAQVQHFSDKTWLQEQPAESIAMLHGVEMDKIMRLVEALDRNAESGSEPTEG